MQFRTELNLEESKQKLTHSDKIIGLGSCFVDSIGDKLKSGKFQVLQNPFGTLFHPVAVENALARIHSAVYYTEPEIFNRDELFFSWDHHTSFNKTSLKSTLEGINSELEKANNFIQNAKVFILTFGTAWVYKIKQLDLIVANCHKVPAQHFEKVLLTDAQIKSSIRNCINFILDINPNAQIITTISPVRHIKDGIVENNISKSKLISNLHDLVSQFENVEYFPAYELMMDDLRDYRFYKEDLIHPNDMAIDYIWDKFSEKYFTEETSVKIRLAERIHSALEHRPINKGTIGHKSFLFNTLRKIEQIEKDFPKDSFVHEKETLKNLMKLT